MNTDRIIDSLMSSFSFGMVFTIIVASYFVIMLIDYLTKIDKTPTWLKRTITFGVGVVVGIIYKKVTDISYDCIIPSFFAAEFVYDAAIKTLLNKIGGGYKK